MSNPETTTENPFQPPEVQQADSLLPFDTEFLISDVCVMCEGELKLPRVCIVSGETTDLVKKTGKLKRSPFWVILLFAVLGLLTPGMMDLFGFLMRPGNAAGLPNSSFAIYLSVYIVALGVACASFFWLRRTVSATWFIVRKQEKRQRRMLAVYVICSAVVVVVAFQLVGQIVIALVFGWFLGSLFDFRKTTRPVLDGTHEGLNVIKGLSPIFLQRVQAIISQHAEKHDH